MDQSLPIDCVSQNEFINETNFIEINFKRMNGSVKYTKIIRDVQKIKFLELYASDSKKSGYLLSKDHEIATIISNEYLKESHDKFKKALNATNTLQNSTDIQLVPSDMVNYSYDICQEYLETLSLLLFKKKYYKLNHKKIIRLGLIISIITNTLNPKNNNFQLTLGATMKHFGLNHSCQKILNKFGILTSNAVLTSYLDKMALHHNSYVSEVKSKLISHLKEEIINPNVPRPLSYSIVFDNLDKNKSPREVSIVYDKSDMQLHFCVSLLFKDVVSGHELDDSIPRTPLENIPVHAMYNLSEQESSHLFKYLRYYLIKIISHRFPNAFKNIPITQHYEHQFSKEFSKKIDQFSGDFFFHNESDGLIEILKGQFTPGTKSVRYIWYVRRNIYY